MKEVLTIVALITFAFFAWCIEALLDARKLDRVEIVILALLAVGIAVTVGLLALHFGRF